MTIYEAFELLLSDGDSCKKLGMGGSNYRMMRKRLRDNDPVLTIQTMLSWLEKAGWTYNLELIPPNSKKV